MATPQTPGMDPWMIQPRERARYREQFDSLKPNNGVVTGEQAKEFLLKSQLPPAILGQIWALSDTDADGKMDINEFSIACKLINLKLRGFEIPKALPPTLVQSLKSLSAGDASVTGLTNGAANIPPQNNVGSLVNLSGLPQVPVQPVQPLIGGVPMAGSIPRPLIGPPPTNGPLPGHGIRPASPMNLPASRQNRQNVAANIHATTHTASKPPARPAPPSVGMLQEVDVSV